MERPKISLGQHPLSKELGQKSARTAFGENDRPVICAKRIEGDPTADERVLFYPPTRAAAVSGVHRLVAERRVGPVRVGYDFGLVDATGLPFDGRAWEIDTSERPNGAPSAFDEPSLADAPSQAEGPSGENPSANEDAVAAEEVPHSGWYVRVKPKLHEPKGGAKRTDREFYAAKARWDRSTALVDLLPDLALVVPEFATRPGALVRTRYFGAFDVDGNWGDGMERFDLERWIMRAAASGKNVEDACVQWPEMAAARAEAERLAQAARDGGATNVLCYFTGMKGFRVLFRHPEAFRTIREDEMVGAPALEKLLFPVVLRGVERSEFTRVDHRVYDVDKGLKPDVYPHPKTGVWPTRGPLGARPGDPADPALRDALVEHWAWLASAIPANPPELRGSHRTLKRRTPAEEGGDATEGAAAVEASGGDPSVPQPNSKRARVEREIPMGSAWMIRGRRAEAGTQRTHQEWLPWGHRNLRAARDDVLRTAEACVRSMYPYYTHEVVPRGGKPVRLFLDVDKTKGRECRPLLETGIVRTAQAFLRRHYPTEMCVALVLAARGAVSGHVVFPRIFHHPRAIRALVRHIRRELPADESARVDEAVCAEGRTIRMPGASKRIKTKGDRLAPAGQPLEPVGLFAGDGTPMETPPLNAALRDGSVLPPDGAAEPPLPAIIRPEDIGGPPEAGSDGNLRAEHLELGWTLERAREAARAAIEFFARDAAAPEVVAGYANDIVAKRMTDRGAFGWLFVARNALWCPVGKRYHSEKEKWTICVNFRKDRLSVTCRSDTCSKGREAYTRQITSLLPLP